jgi:hypothetical protein
MTLATVLIGVTIRPLILVVQPLLLLPVQVVDCLLAKVWAFAGTTDIENNNRMGKAKRFDFCMSDCVSFSNLFEYCLFGNFRTSYTSFSEMSQTFVWTFIHTKVHTKVHLFSAFKIAFARYYVT